MKTRKIWSTPHLEQNLSIQSVTKQNTCIIKSFTFSEIKLIFLKLAQFDPACTYIFIYLYKYKTV